MSLLTKMTLDADTVDALEGDSTTMGGGIGPFGIDAISFSKVDDFSNDELNGVQFSLGKSVVPIGIHTIGGKTRTLWNRKLGF